MALKDEPSPKCTFPGAGTSFLKSYKKLAAATATAAALAAAAAPGSKTPWPSRTNRVQNTMALKDEPSPKYMFPGAGTSLLKSYKKLAVGAEILLYHFPAF